MTDAAPDPSFSRQPRRRLVRIDSATGPGDVNLLDFGDETRPVDLVFSNANGFNALTYRTLLAPLAERMRIVAVDQRGHGGTLLPTANAARRRGWNDLRADLLGLLKALGVGRDQPPVVLAGHSMGGTISLLAAGKRPDWVRGLVLFDPVLLDRKRAWLVKLPGAPAAARRRMPLIQSTLKRRRAFASGAEAFNAYRGRGAFKTWPDEMLLDYLAAGLKETADGGVELACAPEWEASNYASQAHDSWGAARRLRCPVTVLKAEHASTCGVSDGAEFFSKTPQWSLTTVPGTSHFLPMERPELAREALVQAVGGMSAAAQPG